MQILDTFNVTNISQSDMSDGNEYIKRPSIPNNRRLLNDFMMSKGSLFKLILL